MHTFESSSVRFHHNGDFSGEAIIVDKQSSAEFRVPFDDLKDFVAEYVRDRKIGHVEETSENEEQISALEQASADELFGLPES